MVIVMAETVIAYQHAKKARHKRDTVKDKLTAPEHTCKLELEYELWKQQLHFEQKQLEMQHEKERWLHEERV
ncbi:hypothetical protein PHLCEN_2v6080 [Hermanssonia centrifuga]|uniref:Uncharacterized protein n=1 Tax=Hermanssonia centrifuga TaxID=98765 RepID=A0A2R6P0I0_9APHY|nr:hypothetical protein PHLCEN_2v6080 [Hermanssonia centrifuga]